MGWKNILILSAMALVACGLFVFLAFSDNGVKLVDAKRRELDSVLAANRQMEVDNAEMARTIKRLQEDPFYIENVARQEYKLAGPSDIVFTFDKERTGKPVWPEERAAYDTRRKEEARKLKLEQEGKIKPAASQPKKAETKKAETAKANKPKETAKTADTKKDEGKKAEKPETKKSQKKKET